MSGFPWETLGAIIDGRSAIDLARLHFETQEEAAGFLHRYGFDLQDSEDRRAVEALRQEALGFVEDLLKDDPIALPQVIREQDDVLVLMLWASLGAPHGRSKQLWSCALLRVMHTLAHSGSNLELRYDAQIHAQILAQFEPHIHETADAKTGETKLCLGAGEDAVPLAYVNLKRDKPRRSVLIKLLHKPGNVATTIYDRIGVRLVTEDRLDALCAVRYLRKHHVIVFSNVVPERTRNSLIDLEAFHALYDRTPDRGSALREAVAQLAPPKLDALLNPHSAEDYRSIQFTCRQLIKPRDGSADFFYPYEVQILERPTYERLTLGNASHDAYRARQLETVKRRVLGGLLSDSATEVA